jgi:hypothetical protein
MRTTASTTVRRRRFGVAKSVARGGGSFTELRTSNFAVSKS